MIVLESGYIYDLYNADENQVDPIEKGKQIYDVIDLEEDELLMKAGLGQ